MKMTKMRSWMVNSILLISSLTIGGCGIDDSVRYKITVEVETKYGIKYGNSVNEVSYERPYQIPSIGENRGQRSLNGEAVVVDVPGNKKIFVLLQGADGDLDYASFIPERMLGYNGKHLSKNSAQIWPKSGDEVGLPRADMPLLVEFDDISRPNTVKEFDPRFYDKYGNKIKSIKVEVTKEMLTDRVQKTLPWLKYYDDSMIDGGRTNNSLMLSNQITSISFMRGK